jgi:hypothetical protein
MAAILNVASTMACPHGGSVQSTAASASALAIGAPMLSESDAFTVVGCPFHVSGAPSPCVTVRWQSPAIRVLRSGAPVLTTASVGLCLTASQADQGWVVIAETQSRVLGT